jgi:hypothetical protein
VTFLPNDAYDAAATTAVRQRQRRRARAATVFLAWHKDLCLPVPAVLRR